MTTTPSVPGHQPDGLVEHADAPGRPRLTWQEIQALVPERPGPVILPGYGTQVIRLTDRGRVHPTGMSYWPNTNNHAGLPTLHVLVSIDDVLCVLPVDKASWFPGAPMPTPFRGTGEGAYWSWTQPNIFYLPQGSTLVAFDIQTWTSHVVVQAPSEIRQAHSSADGQVHSFTINGRAGVFLRGNVIEFHARDYDECQIDKSGRWLLIKQGRDNQIVDRDTGQQWTITDAKGAAGHSDLGWGYMIGEDDQTNPGGVFRRWDFTEDGPVDRGPVWHVGGWSPMTRYVSCSARPEGGPALFSGATADDRPRANELVSVALDGSLLGRVLCPNLTQLTLDSDGKPEYWSITRANLDPPGEYACFAGNLGGDRGDLFLVRIAQ